MPKQDKLPISKKYLLACLILALSLYVVLPQLGDFKTSWQALQDQNYTWTLLAVALTYGTYLAAGANYRFLALERISYAKTVLMQFAAMFINRLVPAGLGATGLNYLYLRANKHKPSQAGVVVAINNLMGFLGHLCLFLLLVALARDVDLPIRQSDDSSTLPTIIGLVVLAVFVLSFIFARQKLAKIAKDVKKQVLSYRKRPLNLIGALGSSMSLTMLNILALQCCMLAIGVHLSLVEALFVFSFGVGSGAALPTPGGLGGFEAGLAASMVGYGISGSDALAVALLYRLISYWLTLATGAGAFVFAQQHNYFKRAD